MVKNITKLFADDTKIYSIVNNPTDKENLQQDLTSLSNWSDKWLLKFNQKKCKHLHLGQDPEYTYYMEGKEITKTDEEKDLGIIVDTNLKFVQHINTKVKKANQMLGIIKRSFSFMDKEMLLILFKSLVRPHLEYGSSVWSVIYKKEELLLENVQRRATKLIPELKTKDYQERLKILGLPTLKYRRLRADMVQTYKIINNIDKVETNKLFHFHQTNTRGHKYKLYKCHCKTNVRKHFFSQRIINPWNNLPEAVVNAKSVNCFKSELNKCWRNSSFKFVLQDEGPEAGKKSQRQNGP